MKKCQAPDHPHCTHWVAEGEAICAAGHSQAATANASRTAVLKASAGIITRQAVATTASNLHLHFSGYDPRAAGGRQTIRLELRGTLPPDIRSLAVQLRSELIATGASTHRLLRTTSGQWQPLLISFTSKNKEHGQYLLEVALLHEPADRDQRKWICTSVLFVPRSDATLTEIHSVFLAVQKNVRVLAEDGAIATLSGWGQSSAYAQGNMNIEINAKDAAIAKLDMQPLTGKSEIAMGTIAWDEELIEVAPEQEATTRQVAIPNVAKAPARIVTNTSNTGANSTSGTSATTTAIGSASLVTMDRAQPHGTIRLFARDEWVLGRMEQQAQADILLSHRTSTASENARLSRRISARHAVIRRKGEDAEIIDVSRYGTLLDGISMEKDQSYTLRTGMHIEFCASVRGIVKLQVLAIQPHAIIVAEADANPGAELLYLLKSETRPAAPDTSATSALPLLFHFQGSFWYRDGRTLQDTRLNELADIKAMPPLAAGLRYFDVPYKEMAFHVYPQIQFAWQSTTGK
ncbi:FHA domain-containing protein [Undibacterium sp. CY18W]|uniref:FHA domain-containing protein n=1 Tax=Undibacterium hunanense TaxID=2762292 RepID=A0ABR6ZMU6_9BURK|nr:FHA domain-containing protein [Undibacterium hunanense]MBC3916740.1 FHA domain-containing protein [Undibacterium hunanense]